MRFIIPLCATILASIGANSSPLAPKSALEDFWRARTTFNSELMYELDHRARSKNFLVPTFGIHSALTALMLGSKDQTFSQLWNTLGYKDTNLDKEAIMDLYKQAVRNVTGLKNVGLNSDNLLIFDPTTNLNNDFENMMVEVFNAGLMREDFRTKEGTKTASVDMNNWVQQVTGGKITKLFEEDLPEDTSAIIASAFSIKALWNSPFDPQETFTGKFTKMNGEVKDATFMKIPASALKGSRFSQNYGFQNIEIPIDEDGSLYFGVMIAQSAVGGNFDCCSTFTEFIHGTHEASFDLILPKFNISSTPPQLQDVLMKMGLNDLFTPQVADLSGIDGRRDLYLSQFASKLQVKIDEEGVEGAASTAEVLSTSSPAIESSRKKPMQIVVDSPFIFTISDRKNFFDFVTGFVYEV